MTSAHCKICYELDARAGGGIGDALRDARIRNAVFQISRHFVVIPSISPVAYGHVLVVSKDHRGGLLGSASDVELDEIRDLACMYQSELWSDSHADAALLCFEHGCICSEDVHVMCGTSHGHIHMVMLPQAVAQRAMSSISHHVESDSLLGARKVAASSSRHYVALWTVNSRGEPGVVERDSPSAPQQVQRAIAAALNDPIWDWRALNNSEHLKRFVRERCQTNVRIDGAFSLSASVRQSQSVAR